MSRPESNRRYLAYLSTLALTVAPIALPVVAATTASAEVSAERVATLKTAAVAIAENTEYRPSAFGECYLDWADRPVCFG